MKHFHLLVVLVRAWLAMTDHYFQQSMVKIQQWVLRYNQAPVYAGINNYTKLAVMNNL